MSAIYTIWLRNMIRYYRSKSRMIGSLAQPLIFFLVLGFGLNSALKMPGGGSYLEFIIPGVISMTVLFTAIFSGIQIIWDRQFGFLKETLVAPISRMSISVGQTLGGATTALFQGILILIISMIVGGFFPGFMGLIIAFSFMVLIGLAFTALGIAIASQMEDMQGFQLIMNFLVFPVFFLSGAFFPITNAPTALKIISYADPLTYGVEGIRYGLLGSSQINPVLSLVVLGGFTAVIIAISGYLFTRIKI